MAHKRKGMGVFDTGKHLDKNDPGMPQFLRRLNERKKEKSKVEKPDKVMSNLQSFVK